MRRQDVIQLIIDAIREFLPPAARLSAVDGDTRLVGGNTVLDSTALVSLITEVEQQIDDRCGVSITIADDRALSQERSPFRTVNSLADYVITLCEEAAGATRV